MTHPHNAKLQRFFSSSQIAFKKILSALDPFVPSLLNFLSPWLLLGLQQSSDLWENGWGILHEHACKDDQPGLYARKDAGQDR